MISLAVQFLALATAVACAGVVLARAADVIAERTGLGRLLVGSIALAAATSLPELSVDIAAVRAGHADLAAGDLFGSSLMNLLILAGIDLCRRNGRKMLSREAASHALSATLDLPPFLQAASPARQATTEKVHPLLDRQRQPTGDEFVELPIAFFRQGRQRCAAVLLRLGRGRLESSRGFSTSLLCGHGMNPRFGVERSVAGGG